MGISFISLLRDHPKCLSCPSVRTQPTPAPGIRGPLVIETFLLCMVVLTITAAVSRNGLVPSFRILLLLVIVSQFCTLVRAFFLLVGSVAEQSP